MNKFLAVLVAVAGTCAVTSAMACASDADKQGQAAHPPAAAASTPDGGCAGERVTTKVVNGKTVKVRQKARDCPQPKALRLWD
jgi:hypothetical protein